MQAVWNWFNGNKTVIGLALGFLLSKAWFTGFVGTEVVDILEWISGTFLVVGVAHKVAKATTTEEPT